MAGQLAHFDAAAMAQERAATGDPEGRVQAGGADQRIAPERRAGGVGTDGGRGERRIAAVHQPGTELKLPAGPFLEGAATRSVVIWGSEGEQVRGHRRAPFRLQGWVTWRSGRHRRVCVLVAWRGKLPP